jgi:hypothetical protein
MPLFNPKCLSKCILANPRFTNVICMSKIVKDDEQPRLQDEFVSEAVHRQEMFGLGRIDFHFFSKPHDKIVDGA